MVRSAGLSRAVASDCEDARLVLLDEGFEMLTFHRPVTACYFVDEHLAERVKCLTPEGPVYHEVAGFLGARGATPLAVFSDFPGLGDAPPEPPRRVCDPQPFGRAFGARACIDFVVDR